MLRPLTAPRPRHLILLGTALVMILFPKVPCPAGTEIEPRVDLLLEQRFEHLIGKEAGTLAPNQRIVASKTYVDSGDGGYRTYAMLDTAGSESLKSERYEFEFRKAGGNKWQLVEKHLQDASVRLFREADEAKRFFRFESVEGEREGLSIRASTGSALAYELNGEISRIVLAADDLGFEYLPPEYLGTHRAVYQGIRNNWKDEFVFTPEVVEYSCDPASCRDVLSRLEGLEEAGEESLGPALGRYYTDATREVKNEREKEPFSGFRLPYRANERRLTVSIKKPGADHWIGLEYDSDSDHEVRFHVDGMGAILGYPSQASRDNVDAVVIERRDDSDRALYHLTGIKGVVEIGLVEAEMLHGDITFALEAKRELDAVPFSLQGILIGADAQENVTFHVSELDDGGGRQLSWVRTGLTEGIVLLPEPVPAGSPFVVHMEFQTNGNVVKLNPSYSYMTRSGWLPFVVYGDKIDEFDLTVRVPSRYKTLGVGTCISRKKQGKANVSRWVANSPIAFPTIIFGDYHEAVPKTKAVKSDGTEIPVTVHVDKTSLVDWGIRTNQLRSPGEIAASALNIYRTLFDVDYPFGKLDLVNDPLEALGAQAPASIVYLGSAIFRSDAALTATYAGDMTTLTEERISHEVAHQWWGSLVSSANWRHYWFVESLAEYSSALFMEVLASDGFRVPEKGRKAYLSMVGRWGNEVRRSGLICSVQDSSVLYDNNGYHAAVYSRGPYAFHILRQTFGDKKFFAFLKELAGELAGKEIVTGDIQTVAERAFGGVGQDGKPYTVDLDWFFNQWIREVGLPEYEFAYDFEQSEDGQYVVRGTVGQRVFAGRHPLELSGVYYRGVMLVTVYCKDKQEYNTRIVVEGPETPFAFKVPAKPLEVTLNKRGEMLAR